MYHFLHFFHCMWSNLTHYFALGSQRWFQKLRMWWKVFDRRRCFIHRKEVFYASYCHKFTVPEFLQIINLADCRRGFLRLYLHFIQNSWVDWHALHSIEKQKVDLATLVKRMRMLYVIFVLLQLKLTFLLLCNFKLISRSLSPTLVSAQYYCWD